MDNNNNEKYLHRLIELYFDGMTSLDEERQLRRLLADGRFRSAEAEEARAVMCVAVGLSPTCSRKPRRLPAFGRVAAAAVAAVAVVSAGLYFGSGEKTLPVSKGQECYAYVGTELVRDPEVVMEIMQAQLAEMSEVADDFSRDIENTILTIKYTEQ
ncbi:MAG: hypothetical protein K2I56_08985 [Muribaculaceae bacterium]|nr:hypothetical protein [Muribaculaceae bacterium]